jgi:hypothetical protein
VKSKPRPFKLTAPIPKEGEEAVNLLKWAQVIRHNGTPLADLLIMIPNGAILAGDAKHRAMQMARMKRQGFKVGTFDYFLAIPTPLFHGLWLELKRTHRGRVSDAQREFDAWMQEQHYATAICEGWEAAAKTILGYLR